ncbi:MAG TPA: cytochrome c [Thiopseudomonas sp.]|nr:cytochrome c [Thiopseudomonas sp.]
MFGSSLGNKSAYIDPSDKQLVADGKQIYAKNCASCHGANLEGEPNWRMRQANGRLPAPPHDATGHTWHHADALLIEITKNGLVPGVTAPEGYVSDMPAYSATLSDQDIRAVLAYIKSSWPKHALARQKEISQQQK